jgi:hypothetical protein
VAPAAAAVDSGDRWRRQVGECVGEDQGELRDSFWALGKGEAHHRMCSLAVVGQPVKLMVEGRRGG